MNFLTPMFRSDGGAGVVCGGGPGGGLRRLLEERTSRPRQLDHRVNHGHHSFHRFSMLI